MSLYFGRPAARAAIAGGSETPLLRGSVWFYQQAGGVLVVADLSGLPPQDAFYGFHIHEGSSCTGAAFADTGSHYNPVMLSHPNHDGDLPPLLGCNGRAFLAVMTDRFSIKETLGRTVVIHSGADDFTTQPTGNAGRKIGCGVVVKV